jgi:hypothetical protein
LPQPVQDTARRTELHQFMYELKNEGNNEVGDIGCMHLSRVKWDTLQNLLLGILIVRKIKTELLTGDVRSSVKESGPI